MTTISRIAIPVFLVQLVPAIVAVARAEWVVVIYLAAALLGGWVLGLMLAFWMHERVR